MGYAEAKKRSDEIQHFQDYGVRKWAGDDLIELQGEPLAALQALVEPYAPCIIQGCEVTENGNGGIKVSPGLVALKGKDSKGNACVKIARFAGIESETSIYLTLACEAVNRLYGDGNVKDIAYDYKAVASTQRPEEPFLEISGKEVPRLVDTLGITQKLDREGGDASDVKVNFAESKTDTYTDELKSGNPLSKLFGAIKKCLTSITTKLEGIDDNANAYTHPLSAAGAKTSGLYKITTDANGHVTGAAAVAKSDITALGIPDKNTTYSVATTSAAGLMSASDKTKLNKYPTIDSGTMVIKDIYYTLKRTPNSSSLSLAVQPEASTSGAGLMSAADKKKLDGAYIYYMARVQCSGGVATAIQVYNPSGVVAKFSIEKVDGYNACKTSIGRPSGYAYAKPMILGESSGSAFITSHTGTGSFNVYIINNSNIGQITSSTFTIVMIAHN